MARYGYFLSSEEYEPASLIDQARKAEEAGFDALWISDHYHPWVEKQGQSPFVWSIIGGIVYVTQREKQHLQEIEQESGDSAEA